MAAPATTDEFLDLVRKSGVTDERRFSDYVSRNRAANSLGSDASRMAGLLVRDGILTQFQAEQILLGKWRRFTIGKYKVLERLGAGGMGSVYLCEHKLMRRRVAVKVLPTAKANDQSALERFYREARAVAALDHPNIVHAYDIDQDDQLHFLVMEYVDGVNFQDMVKKSGPIDILRACHYIRQSAIGLEHAHLAGLVHRDIKPGNILVDRVGTVKILDMGLARFFNDEDDILTKKFDENVLGTADYLAPEQALDSHSVDIRADIYSLGATFYFLLTGRTPFGEGTVAQKLLWHQTRQPKVVSEFRKDVPPDLVAIISKMMDKDKENRFQNPADLADALAPFTTIPIGPPPDSEMPTLSPAAQGGPPPDLSGDTAVSIKAESSPAPKALQGMSYSTIAKPASSSSSKPSHAGETTASASSNSNTPPVSPTPASRSSGERDAPMFTLADDPVPAQPASPRPRPNLPTPRKSPGSGVKQGSPPQELRPVVTATLAEPEEEEAAFVPTGRPASSKKMKSATARPKPSASKNLYLFGGIGVVVLILLIAVIAVMALKSGKPPEPVVRKPFEVTSVKGGANTYAKVLDVFKSKKLRKGDVIQLNDDEHYEYLFFDPKQFPYLPEDITIKPAHDKHVVWMTDNKVRYDQPVLELKGAAGLKISGLTIDGTLEGTDRVKNAVEIRGTSPGLIFENVKFSSFQNAGVKISNVEGNKDRPVVFKDCDFYSDPADKTKGGPKAAISFALNPSMFPASNDYIEIDTPRFSGVKLPFLSADPKNAKIMGPGIKGVTPAK